MVPVPVPAPEYFSKGIPVPRVFFHRCTERAEVPGTNTEVVQNAQSVGYGYYPRDSPGNTRAILDSRGRKKQNRQYLFKACVVRVDIATAALFAQNDGLVSAAAGVG